MSFSKINKSELLELQEKFRKKEIKEENIPQDKLKLLKELYNEQIKSLEEDIEHNKQEILKIRKRISI